VSAAFASEYLRVLPLLSDLLEVDVLVGCSGSGIVGGGQEIEEGPVVSLSLAVLPDVALHPFHLRGDQLPDLDAPPSAWIEQVGVAPQAQPHFLLLADGFSSRISELVQGLDFAYPGAVKVGGLASGGRGPRGNALFLLDARTSTPRRELYREGTVGLALSGNVVLDAVVAQGVPSHWGSLARYRSRGQRHPKLGGATSPSGFAGFGRTAEPSGSPVGSPRSLHWPADG
jgi:small ligand-binding sensory domain FIST